MMDLGMSLFLSTWMKTRLAPDSDNQERSIHD